jgi:hypothetical protein
MSVGEAAGSSPLANDWKQRRRRLQRWMLRLLVGAAIVVALGIGTIRVINLWGIPDAPEPFDIAAFEAGETVPDEANAAVLFRKAGQMVGEDDSNRFKPLWGGPKTAEWSETSPEVRDWVEKNRPALEVWRRGTDRPQAAPLPGAGGDRSKTRMWNADMVNWLTFALLEASRLEDEGDFAGAWRWHKARLRMVLLVGREGTLSDRYGLFFYFQRIAARAQAWAEGTNVTVPLLRQAIADVEAMDALHDDASNALKREYIKCIFEISALPGVFEDTELERLGFDNAAVGQRYIPPYLFRKVHRQLDLLLNVEPERSQRLARLVWANWLAQADKPAADRTKIVSTYPLVFEADPGSNPPVASARLAQLAAAAPVLTITRGGPKPPRKGWPARDNWPDVVALDRRARAGLIVGLAIRIYMLENNGKEPATSQALVGKILPKLPDDFIPPEDEAPPATTDSP